MGIHMAAKDTQDIGQEYKAMKKAAKQQKKAHKKDKKKSKRERKYAKKEAKMRKKGVWLDDLTTQTEEEVEVVATAEDFEEKPWVRKSTDDIPLLEKKIDMMTDRKEKSDLHSMFEERFGESLMTPETYQEYELSESEKRRLEAIRAVEVEPEPAQVQEVPVEAPPVEAKKGRFGRSKKKKAAEPAQVPGAPQGVAVQTAAGLTGPLEYATIGKRFVAVLIDGILISILTSWTFILVPIVGPLVMVIYFTIIEGKKGQSLGKMAMKIHSVNTDGSAISMGTSFKNSLEKGIPIWNLIAYIAALFSKTRQRPMQKWAGVIVVPSHLVPARESKPKKEKKSRKERKAEAASKT
jgi:uncharacterized RDD family membrane protein YckC